MNQLPELEKLWARLIDGARSYQKGKIYVCLMLMLGLAAYFRLPLVYSQEENKTQVAAQSENGTTDTTTQEPQVKAEEDKAKAINTEVQKEKEAEAPPPVDDSVVLASKDTTSPGNVSLDFKDADILNVLRVLSLKSGTNIVAGPEVQGTVTIRLQDVPWEKAMEVVLRTYGYVYEREANIIRVTTKDNLATEELVTETFVLNYTTATDIEASIKDILTERGRVKSVPKANTIIVSDAPTNMYKISQVIRSLDKVTPQCYIDAKVVTTTLGENEDLGVNWNIQGQIGGSKRPTTFPFTASGNNVQGNLLNSQILKQFYPGQIGNRNLDPSSFPTDPAAPTFAGNSFTYGTLDLSSFKTAIGLLRSKTNTKIISNPRIVVLNNQTAKVQVGNQIPIPTFERNEQSGSFVISGFSYRDTGIVLKVTPHINQSREILVELKPEVSKSGDPVDFGGTGGFKAPSFETSMAETQVLIRDGETIAIGGLMKDVATVQNSGVPGLSKIPVFGKLFRNSLRESGADKNQKTETLFFVTITIVDTQGQPLLPTKSTTTVNNATQSPSIGGGIQKVPV